MNSQEIEFLENNDIIVHHMIAKGGYGEVYYVFHQTYKTYFALKKIPEFYFNESEIDCLKSINDPRIVHLYKYYKFNEHVYLLLEYCPNDIEKLMKMKKKFTNEELTQIAYEMILTIKACHDRKIAHCDIKPSNFMIDMYGRIKICDFGLSTIIKENSRSSQFKGTMLFMAPEFFKMKDYNPFAADIWALGVTLYYMATSNLPFYANSQLLTLQQILSGLYNADAVANPLLRHVIERCIVNEPSSRATVYELLQNSLFAFCSPNKRMKTTYNQSKTTIEPRIKPFASLRKALVKKPKMMNNTFKLINYGTKSAILLV